LSAEHLFPVIADGAFAFDQLMSPLNLSRAGRAISSDCALPMRNRWRKTQTIENEEPDYRGDNDLQECLTLAYLP